MVASAKDRMETRGVAWGGKVAPRAYRRPDERLSPLPAYPEHTTLTASVFGDPRPGQSALDKRRASQ